MKNYPSQKSILQTKKVNQIKNKNLSLYDQANHSNGVNRIFIKKNPHSLEKIPKETNTSDLLSTISKQINEKKLASHYSLGNIFNNESNTSFLSIINKENRKKDYSVSTTINESPTFIKVNNKKKFDDLNKNDPHIKERVIQNLRTEYGLQRFKRKKILSMNMNTDSLLNNNTGNHSFFENESKIIKPSLFNKNELPLKLHTSVNKTKVIKYNPNINISSMNNYNYNYSNNNNNNNGTIGFISECDKSMNSQTNINSLNEPVLFNAKIYENKGILIGTNNYLLNQNLHDLELKMERMLKENKNNSKVKKYKIIKRIFEEYIKITTGEAQVFLKKLLFAYHEVVSVFSIENGNLKRFNESLQNNKKFLDLSTDLKKKEHDIELLKKKVNDIRKTSHDIVISKEESNASTQLQMSPNEIIKSSDNIRIKHVYDLNTKNVKDLDALYFYDRVEMQTEENLYSKIPKLDLACFCDDNNDNNGFNNK